MSLRLAINLFDEAGLDHPYKIIAQLPDCLAVAILAGISADRRTDIMRKLPEADRLRVTRLLPQPVQDQLAQLLRYAPTTTGGMMTTEFLSLPPDWRVDQALAHIWQVAKRRNPSMRSTWSIQPHKG